MSVNRKSNLWENFNLLALILYFFYKKRCCFFCFNNVCFASPDINVMVFKITRQFWSVMRIFEKHFNVQFLGGGAVVDLRFQFQEVVDFKKGFENYNLLKGLPNRGQLFERAFRHLSSQCLHEEKNGFIILDILSGNVRDLSPLKMSKKQYTLF